MPIQNLSYDVWVTIASFSTPNNLANLSATSSRFLPARHLFYKSITLRSGLPGSGSTLDLLARDKELASSVRQLTLIQSKTILPGTKKGPLINFEALTNLTSLKTIAIQGIIFGNDAEQIEFGRVLAPKTSVSLKELTYIGLLVYSGKWPTTTFGGLGNLETIAWIAEENSLGPLWDILSRSRRSCHVLRFPLTILGEIDSSNHRLSWIQPSNLRSLNVDCARFAISMDGTSLLRACTNLSLFLKSCSTLEKLRITGLSGRESIQFYPDSLQRLRSFRGDASVFNDLVSARLQCMSTTLRHLAIGFGPYGIPVEAIASRLNALLPPTDSGDDTITAPFTDCFSMLQELETLFSPNTYAYARGVRELIRRFARCCGHSLEVWRGHMPLVGDISPDEFAELFGLFEKLRLVEFAGTTTGLDVNRGSICALYVRTLANKCRELREVRRTDFNPRWKHSWNIVRTPDRRFDSLDDGCPSPDCTSHPIYILTPIE